MAKLNNADDATEQMFALVGRAITRWSFVEEDLCQVFSVCTSIICARPRGGIEFLDSHVSMSVFFAVENFRANLGLVDAAVTSRLAMSGEREGEMAAEWSRLKDKIRKLSLKRNKLAHWTVLPAFQYEGLRPARLVPPIGSPAYYRETGWRSTSATLRPLHLEHLERAFWLVGKKVRDFASRLARNEALFDRYAQLLARQMESLDRTDPTRAEQIRRAQSSPE